MPSPVVFGPQKMEPLLMPIFCEVCEQRAYGFNYDVVSCNACKMFFRRRDGEVSKDKCRYIGKCFEGDDLKERRPKCRACRMKKCIAVGMNRHSSSVDSTSSSDCQIIAVKPPAKPIVTQFHVDADLLKSLEELHNTRFAVYRVINIDEDPTFCDMVASSSKLGCFARPQEICWEHTKRKLKPWGSLGVMLVVEVIKTMQVYNELLLSDRLLLLKNVAFKSHHLSIAFDSFQRKKNRVLAPTDGEILPEVLYGITQCREVIMEFLTVPVEPLLELQVTDKEFFLLNMIIICNPGIAGLSPGGQETLIKYQSYYSRVLLDLCLLKEGRTGPSRFGKILAINEKMEKQVALTLKLDKMLRQYWHKSYYFPKILQEACRVEFTGTELVARKF